MYYQIYAGRVRLSPELGKCVISNLACALCVLSATGWVCKWSKTKAFLSKGNENPTRMWRLLKRQNKAIKF